MRRLPAPLGSIRDQAAQRSIDGAGVEEDGGDVPALYVSVDVLNGKKQTAAAVHIVGDATDVDVAQALLLGVLGSASNCSPGAWMALLRLMAERSG